MCMPTVTSQIAVRIREHGCVSSAASVLMPRDGSTIHQERGDSTEPGIAQEPDGNLALILLLLLHDMMRAVHLARVMATLMRLTSSKKPRDLAPPALFAADPRTQDSTMTSICLPWKLSAVSTMTCMSPACCHIYVLHSQSCTRRMGCLGCHPGVRCLRMSHRRRETRHASHCHIFKPVWGSWNESTAWRPDGAAHGFHTCFRDTIARWILHHLHHPPHHSPHHQAPRLA